MGLLIRKWLYIQYWCLSLSILLFNDMDDLIFALIVSDEICTYYLISLVGGILYHYMHWGNGITLDVLYHVQRNWYYKILIYPILKFYLIGSIFLTTTFWFLNYLTSMRYIFSSWSQGFTVKNGHFLRGYLTYGAKEGVWTKGSSTWINIRILIHNWSEIVPVILLHDPYAHLESVLQFCVAYYLDSVD